MRRRDHNGNFTELPPLDVKALSEDHQLYLRIQLAGITNGAMRHGAFVEAHLARLLGADVPTVGISPWDLWIDEGDGVKVEVKACGLGKSYRISGPKDVDVWVFVTYANQADGVQSFRYAVAPASAVTGPKRTMSQRKVFATLATEVDATTLRAAVLAAARSV